MSIDISTFTSTLQSKLNNASTLQEKELLLLTKSLEAFSSVYDMKDMAEAISQVNDYVAGQMNDMSTDVAAVTAAMSNLDYWDKPLEYTRDPTINDVGPVGRWWFNTASGKYFFSGGTQLGKGVWYGLQGEYIAYARGWTYNTGYNSSGSDTNYSYTWTVPSSVTSISVVLVGAGGAGHYGWSNGGGSGGALGYVSDMSVTPGETLTISHNGRTPANQNAGNHTILSSNTRGELFRAQRGGYSGGNSQNRNNNYSNVVAGEVTPDNVSVGKGGLVQNGYAGGGGAGGYSGNGGNGSYGNSLNGNSDGEGGAGGGGGGYGSSTYGFGGGGGVGIYGEGESGKGSTGEQGNSFYSDRYFGKGGSGGQDGVPNNNSSFTMTPTSGMGSNTSNFTAYTGSGGSYGGGAGGGGTSESGYNHTGGGGAARILIGGRYPKTNTGETAEESFNVSSFGGTL